MPTEGQRKLASRCFNGKRHVVVTPCDLNPCGSADTYEAACSMARELKEANPGIDFYVLSPTEFNTRP